MVTAVVYRGDFNVILAPAEKQGGRSFVPTEGLDLMSFMKKAEVFDAGFSGPSFTWCNNRRGRARVWKQLDWLLANGECADFSASISMVHLARHTSDHAPLKITFATRQDDKMRSFHFLNVWTSQAFLLEVIHNAWNLLVNGSP